MPTIYLIRGVPGSGKSTLAKAMAQATGAIHLEADHFFEKNGVYTYEREKITEAHTWCQDSARAYLQDGKDVIIANTFSRLWEMQPYLDMGYPVIVIECKGRWQNVHGCPESSVQKMLDRWEPLTAQTTA